MNFKIDVSSSYSRKEYDTEKEHTSGDCYKAETKQRFSQESIIKNETDKSVKDKTSNSRNSKKCDDITEPRSGDSFAGHPLSDKNGEKSFDNRPSSLRSIDENGRSSLTEDRGSRMLNKDEKSIDDLTSYPVSHEKDDIANGNDASFKAQKKYKFYVTNLRVVEFEPNESWDSMFHLNDGTVSTDTRIPEDKIHFTESKEAKETSVIDDQHVEQSKGTQPCNEDLHQQSQAKETMEKSLIPESTIKNNNSNCHSLTKEMECQICEYQVIGSVVHYVKIHPNNEVFPSRVAPSVADRLRNFKEVHKCNVTLQNRIKFKQFCYFCNQLRILTKGDWIEHMMRHTGCYSFKCADCSVKFLRISQHNCKEKFDFDKIVQPHFDSDKLWAYLCDVCNFVRFDKTEIENHLIYQHEDSIIKGFKEVQFLSFTCDKMKRETGQRKKYDGDEIATKETRDLSTRRRNIVCYRDLDDGVINDFKTEIRGKRPRIHNDGDELDEQTCEHKKLKEMSRIPSVKNNNPDCHSLNEIMNCQICNRKVGNHMMISHYINVHPNKEVFPSRVAPHVADVLRMKVDHICEKEKLSERFGYKQLCYFCDQIMILPRYAWIAHLIRHTGYFQYECSDCLVKLQQSQKHKCKRKNKNCIRKLPQRIFNNDVVLGYLCDACNFVRFEIKEMETHLRCEHTGNNTTAFKEVIFLSFEKSNEKLEAAEKSNDENIKEVTKVTEKQKEIPTSTASFSENYLPSAFADESNLSWETYTSSEDSNNVLDNTVRSLTLSQMETNNKTNVCPAKVDAPKTIDTQGGVFDAKYVSLCDLYKCKLTPCAFSTDNEENMLMHLRGHEANPTNNSSIVLDWLHCVYCDAMTESPLTLIKHISDEHESSVFQCPHCIYRSCAAYNVVVHLNQHHQYETKSVLVCDGKEKLYTLEKELIEGWRKENVRPLRCTEGCNKITYLVDDFVEHLKNSVAHTHTFKCQFCGFNTLISEGGKHLLRHSIGVYQCIYCHYGVNDIETIRNHMSEDHPTKLLYTCVRLGRKNQFPSDEELRSVESTLIVHIGETVDPKIFKTHSLINKRCRPNESYLNETERAVMTIPLDLSSLSLFTSASTENLNDTFCNGTNEFPNPEFNGVLSYQEFCDNYKDRFTN